jgi:methyl-accepting chemotaxis protein
MIMVRKYNRRAKNFFINRNFQGKIILTLFLIVVVTCLFFSVIVGFFSADSLTISYKNNDVLIDKTPAMLFKNALAANWIFLVTFGTLLLIAALIGTHRIAGPLFRFEKTLNSMVHKDLSCTIQLREKDEGKDLAQQINTFNSILSRDMRELGRRSRAIRDLTRQYEALTAANLTADEIDSICTAIKVNNNKINELLESYHLNES